MKKMITFLLVLVYLPGLIACDGKAGKDQDAVTTTAFHAEVLEAYDDYLMVEPLADTAERRSADKIHVSLENKTASWPIPAVGDLVNIVYDGNIMETYPAQLGTVYNIELISEESQPGGTPVTDAFSVTISYVNWANISEIPTKALNADKALLSDKQHFPIYKFDTLAELAQFQEAVNPILTLDADYDGFPSFSNAISQYNEDFFSENSLVLVYVMASSGSFRYDVGSIDHTDEEFCVHIIQTNKPEVYTMDMAGWFITVAVPDSMMKNCATFDADLQKP